MTDKRRSRRHRSFHASSTTTTNRTVTDARAQFAASVTRGMTVLMEECGYSRERAQTALLREIARGGSDIINNSNSTTVAPGDKEIFATMSSYPGLGVEGAARALTVSKALQKETQDRNVTLLQAIDELTNKLSVANLVRRERSNGHDSESPVPPASPCVSIPPLAQQQQQPQQRCKSTTSAGSTTSSTTGMTTRKTKTANNNNSKTTSGKQQPKANRKRTVEDMNSTTKSTKEETTEESNNHNKNSNSFPKRERSDSLSEVVSAKFGGEEKKDAKHTTTNASAASAAAVVRAKRGRVEEASSSEAPSNAMKRSRATSTAPTPAEH